MRMGKMVQPRIGKLVGVKGSGTGKRCGPVDGRRMIRWQGKGGVVIILTGVPHGSANHPSTLRRSVHPMLASHIWFIIERFQPDLRTPPRRLASIHVARLLGDIETLGPLLHIVLRDSRLRDPG